jgi:hypothetical protein
VAPAFRPAPPRLRIASRVAFAVHFDGDDGRAARPTRARVGVPKAFLNYAQGTTFRIDATAVPAVAACPP